MLQDYSGHWVVLLVCAVLNRSVHKLRNLEISSSVVGNVQITCKKEELQSPKDSLQPSVTCENCTRSGRVVKVPFRLDI